MHHPINIARPSHALALAALALTTATPLQAADTLYGIEFPGATPLYTVNQTTGAFSAIGATGFDSLGDLTSDTRPGQQKIYAVRTASNDLLTLDPATGAGTVVTPITTIPTAFAPIVSLALNPVDGKLYGNTAVGFGVTTADTLYEINPVTGATTLIGPIGFNEVYALGFDQSGGLFGVSDTKNEFIRINPATAASGLIAVLGLDQSFDLASRPSDNVMFLTDSSTDQLYTINTITGATTPVGAEGVVNAVGLAFLVPEPSTWAAGILGLMAVGMGWRRHNR